MRLVRLASAVAFSLTILAVAACGGGGGGTTPSITVPGATSTPSGSGGGKTATPSPAPGTSTSPSPIPTSTPVTTPPPTQAPTAAPTPTPQSTPNRTLVVGAGAGEINGNDSMFTGSPNAAEPNDGDYPGGGHGPLNSSIGPDNVPCLQTMYTGPTGQAGDGYHVHPFLGFYYNGKEIALSDGIGMAEPEGDITYQPDPTASPTPKPIPNWTQYATDCYYQMHTHDASGLIHVEAFSAPPGAYGGQKGTEYTLGDFLAVWGVPVTSSNWGPLNGTITIYTSGPIPRGGPKTNPEVGSNTYSLLCTACDVATIDAIPLYSHEVIWVLVGTGNPQGSALPNVAFQTEW